MKIHHLLLLTLPALFAVSCATTSTGTGTSFTQASGSSASVAGAGIGGQFLPAGTGARFALYAVGQIGQHDRMTVHALSYRWSSGVVDNVPPSYLGQPLTFRNTMAEGNVVQATLHSPGVLHFDAAKESSVTVSADVSIKRRRAEERRVVTLRFDRSALPQNELKSAASRDSMLELRRYGVPPADLDVGANRIGWKQ